MLYVNYISIKKKKKKKMANTVGQEYISSVIHSWQEWRAETWWKAKTPPAIGTG